MTYNVVTTQALTKGEYSGCTVMTQMTVTDASGNTHTGATTIDSYGGASSDSFTLQDTVTSYTTNTSQDNSTYALYEAGSYGGQSWGLSSFSLLQSDNAASTLLSTQTDASLSSGGFGQSQTGASVEWYSISGTFIRGHSTTTVVQNYTQSGYTVSEGGSFSNASFGLGSYAYAYAQASQQTTTATGGNTDTTAGADDVGLARAIPRSTAAAPRRSATRTTRTPAPR